MTVLIAEDEPVTARLIEAILIKRRFKTLVASSGEEALRLLIANPDVRLLITDLRMPSMDGLTLVRRLRASPQWAKLPVIICTATGELQSVDQAADLGCTQYLLKPVTPALVVRHVRGALGIRRKQQPIMIPARTRSTAQTRRAA
jgi:putative two-component system response regulator